METLNPFELFGITENSNIQDLRRSYHSLALSCHPDKGGDPEDMKTLTIAYKWIYEQFQESSIHHKSFQDYFGDSIHKEAIPSFTDTLAESYGYTKEQFESLCMLCHVPSEMYEILYVPTFQWILTIHTEPPEHPDVWQKTALEFLQTYKDNQTHLNQEIYIPISIPHGYGELIESQNTPDYYQSHSNHYIKTMTLYQEPTFPVVTTDASLQAPSQLDNYSVDTPISMYDYEEAFRIYPFDSTSNISNTIPIETLYEELQLQRKIETIQLN